MIPLNRARMSAVLVVLWSTVAVMVDVSFARVAFGSIVPSLRNDLHLSLAATGSIATANLVGYVIATPFAARTLHLLGLRRAALIGHAVAAVGAMLMATEPSFLPLLLARAVTGVGGAIGLAAAIRLALDAAPGRRVVASMATWSGIAVGLLIAALAQPALTFPGAWRSAAIVWAAASLFVAIGSPSATASVVDKAVASSTIRGYECILAAYACFGFAFLAFTTFLSLAGNASIEERWLSLATASIVGILLSLRVRNAERAFCAALLIAGAGAVLTLLHCFSGPFLVGIGLSASPGFATAIVRGRVGALEANKAIAHATLAVALGQLVGPLAAGVAADRFGITAVPFISAVVYIAGGLLVLCDMQALANTRRIPSEAVRANVERASALRMHRESVQDSVSTATSRSLKGRSFATNRRARLRRSAVLEDDRCYLVSACLIGSGGAARLA